jgi:hypothetical protein
MEDACKVFNKMPSSCMSDNHDIWIPEMWRRAQRHWNYFKRCKALHPDPVTYVGLLNACASLVALEQGRCAHEQIIQSNCESAVFCEE